MVSLHNHPSCQWAIDFSVFLSFLRKSLGNFFPCNWFFRWPMKVSKSELSKIVERWKYLFKPNSRKWKWKYSLGQNTSDSNKRMILLTEFLLPMYKPVLKLMGLAEMPKSDSFIWLIPLSVIPLSGTHCSKKMAIWICFLHYDLQRFSTLCNVSIYRFFNPFLFFLKLID